MSIKREQKGETLQDPRKKLRGEFSGVKARSYLSEFRANEMNYHIDEYFWKPRGMIDPGRAAMQNLRQ